MSKEKISDFSSKLKIGHELEKVSLQFITGRITFEAFNQKAKDCMKLLQILDNTIYDERN